VVRAQAVKIIARDTLWDAIKVAVIATITFYLSPKVSVWLPNVPGIVIYIATAFVTGFVLLTLYTLVFSKANVNVEWTRTGDSAPLTELDVLFLASGGYSIDSYVVRVSPGKATGLGWIALQIGCRTGLCLDIRALHSPALMVVEGDFDDRHGELARSLPGCGSRFLLTSPVPSDDHWQTARIRFQAGKDTRGTRVSTLRHGMSGANPLSWLCAKLIRAETKAARVRTRWS
jgi:hypothetical protein